jgi:signal transduction histidine kinase
MRQNRVLYWQFWASFWKSWSDLAMGDDKNPVPSIVSDSTPLPMPRGESLSAYPTMGHESELIERIRSEFLANMNHDLRTPLNAVIGFAQIIESEMFGKIDNPQYLEYIRHIQDSGFELLAKIEDLCGAQGDTEAPEKQLAYAGERPRMKAVKSKKHLAVVE